MVLSDLSPFVESGDRAAWLNTINDMKGDVAVRDIQTYPIMVIFTRLMSSMIFGG